MDRIVCLIVACDASYGSGAESRNNKVRKHTPGQEAGVSILAHGISTVIDLVRVKL